MIQRAERTEEESENRGFEEWFAEIREYLKRSKQAGAITTPLHSSRGFLTGLNIEGDIK